MKKTMRKSLAGMVFLAAVLTAGSAASQTNPPLMVQDAVVCRDVVERTPVGPGEVFPDTISRLCCFTRVTGAAAETEIVHNWYYNGRLMASIPLRVASADWRTYSAKRIAPHQTGEWMVEVLAADGTPLTRMVFLIA